MSTAFAFGALLLNEFVHNVTFGFETELKLHNLEANSSGGEVVRKKRQIPVAYIFIMQSRHSFPYLFKRRLFNAGHLRLRYADIACDLGLRLVFVVAQIYYLLLALVKSFERVL